MSNKRALIMSLIAVLVIGIFTFPMTQTAMADENEATVMELDTEYDVYITDSDSASFSFTPEETGRYAIKIYDFIYGAVYLEAYDENYDWWTEGIFEYSEDGGSNVIGNTFEAGVTYYIHLTSWASYSDFSVMLYECESIESISVVSIPATEFDYFDTVSMYGAELEVTRSDGTTASLTMGSYSVTDPVTAESIRYRIYNDEGNRVSTGSTDLPDGTYTVVFYSTSSDVQSASYTITVNELTSATQLELDKDYDVSVTCDDYVWFSYTPKTTGKYAFASFDLSGGGVPYVNLYNDDYCINYASWSDGYNFVLSDTLQAGETYYFKVSCYDYDGTSADFSVHLYEVKTIESISVASLVSEEFEMYTTVSMIGTELKITYTDGSVSSFTLDSSWDMDSNSGDYIYYYIYDENGDWVSDGYALPIGTYTVKFFTDGSSYLESDEYTITVSAPSGTELELDIEYDVEVTNGENVWFTYTPEETGRYLFESMNFSGEYPYVYLYDDDSELGFDSFGGDDGNFAIAYTMEAGKTYYFAASCYDWGISSTSSSNYTVCLSEIKEIESISALSLPAEEFDFFDEVSMNGAELEITYTDGTTNTLTMGWSSVYDSETADTIRYHIYDEEGNVVSSGYEMLPAGTYTVVFYTDEVSSKGYTITVNKVTSFIEMELDTDYDVSVTSDEAVWFSYTPEETGKYVLTSLDITEGDPYAYLCTEDSFLASAGGSNFLLSYTLKAGRTYYFKASCYNYDDPSTSEYSVRLYECKEIESISITSLAADEFELFDTGSMDGTVLQLTYTDGTTSSFTLDYNWQTDPTSCETIYYCIYDENENWASYGYDILEAGTYTVIFYAGSSDNYTDGYTITVSAPSSITELELDAEYNVSVSYEESEWFSYTPDETGRYVFAISDCTGDETYMYVYNEDYCISERYIYSYGSFYIINTLEAGVTYYFKACSLYEDCSSTYTATLYECKTIESISVKTAATDHFTWFDYVSMDGTVLELTYTDGTTSEFTVTGAGIRDSESMTYVYYGIYDESGEWVADSYEMLSDGTYYVYFYAGDAWSEGYAITVGEPVVQTEMELDTDYDVSVSYGGSVWYTYTPDVTGRYVFTSKDHEGNEAYVNLYNEEYGSLSFSYGGWEENTFLMAYTMEAGVTYYFKMECSYYGDTTSAEFTVSLSECKNLESIDITNIEDSFTFGDAVTFVGAELTLTYADGTTSEITLRYNGQSDPESMQYIYYNIYDANGDYIYSRFVGVGTYTVKFYIYDNDEISDVSTFTVSMGETYTELVLDEEYDVSCVDGNGVVFTYTPEVAGTYAFASYNLSGDAYAYLYDENGVITSSDDEGGDFNFLLSYELEAGKTYYFIATAFSSGSSADYNVKLYSLKTLSSVSLSGSSSIVFATDDVVTLDGRTLLITYTDGTTSTLTIDEDNWMTDINSGTYMYYYIYDEKGNWVSDGYYTLSEGNYVAKIYIGGEEEAAATVNITVSAEGYVLGDVNQDGEIDYLDAMTVLRYDAELITLESSQLLAGDVNGDGYVDSLDAILILRYDADLIDSF